MMTFGQRLLHVTHRDRWLLFSTLIECNGTRIQLPNRSEAEELEKAFDHPFFKETRRLQLKDGRGNTNE
ncbi:MAG: hypothetical protein D6743_16135 [Calditrichaeota bacterium]|nr:MAG: hypothetical protein D6743_16135 [Calditrichota bacterium]